MLHSEVQTAAVTIIGYKSLNFARYIEVDPSWCLYIHVLS